MSRYFKRIIAVICIVLLTSSLLAGAAFAVGEDEQLEPYTEIPLYIEGIRVGSGLMLDDTTYVPIRAFCEALVRDVEVRWDHETRTAIVEMPGLSLTAQEGTQYVTANGRCFYAPSGIINMEGSVYVPIRAIAAAFSVDILWNNEDFFIDICVENLAPLASADEFYDETDLLWLSRIINAEAGNQPLDGKIGVGNVVLNRVADPSCPDTIYGVIFDNQYGVQFHVTTSGAIYATPNEESVIAAKLCLEGYETAGTSLYFVNPVIGVTSWFRNTRTFVASIGDHDFYA